MIDFTKPLQTRDGSIKWDKDGIELAPFGHHPERRPYGSLDLINAPEPRVFYARLAELYWANHINISDIHSDIKPPTHKITITGDKCEIEAIK